MFWVLSLSTHNICFGLEIRKSSLLLHTLKLKALIQNRVLETVRGLCNDHWVGAKVHVTLFVDLYSGQILVFSMTLMTVCVLSSM